MKKKEPKGFIKLNITAHQANPSPPVGPALGQRQLNIMDFCKRFNDECKKQNYDQGDLIPVVITYYEDKKFDFITKLPPVPNLIKKELGLKSGSKTPGTQFVGEIKKAQVRKIAEMKIKDMGVDCIESAMRMVEGSCVSMGIKVVE